MKTQIAILFVVLAIISNSFAAKVYPVAVFHGMGDACEFPGMKQFSDQLAEGLNVYVKCIESGPSVEAFTTSLIEQSEKACKKLQEDENLRGNISVVGLSQGALVGRYIVEHCQFQGQVKRYLSIGGPNMGVASMPNCFSGILCEPANAFIRANAYKSIYQDHFGPAQMYYNAKNYQSYLDGNKFLPLLNNQKEMNSQYKQRIEELELMYLTKFEKDTMVNPPASEWFAQWDAKMKTVIPMEEQSVYEQLGLKTLAFKNAIAYLALPGNHLQFTLQDVQQYYIPALAGQKIPNTYVKSEDEEFNGEYIQFQGTFL